MKRTTRFDWDGHLERTPYNKVLRDMHGTRCIIPTMFSPDRSQVYLKSLDVAYRTDDIGGLTGALAEILDNLRRAVALMTWSCERVHLCEVDYLTVWGILYNADALPDGYIYPEHYLEQAWRECADRDRAGEAAGG